MSGVQNTSATITALHTTAIKGTRLRSVEHVVLDERGAVGDRRFFLIDKRDRMRNGKVLTNLQAVVASCEGERLRLEFPDGHVVEDEVSLGETVTARFYSSHRAGRVVHGPWARALSDYTGVELRVLQTESGVDRGSKGAVSLVSRGSLRRLAEQAALESVDVRRFRMLIEVDGVEPHGEDGWLGQELQIGEAAVRFEGHVGRCLVTSRMPETGEIDLPTLDLLREYRSGVESTEPLPFGIYGRVLRGGHVRVGDSVVRVARGPAELRDNRP